jgi:hypothetical protein
MPPAASQKLSTWIARSLRMFDSGKILGNKHEDGCLVDLSVSNICSSGCHAPTEALWQPDVVHSGLPQLSL